MLSFILDASPQVQAAVIAAVVGILTVLLSEVFFVRRERRARREDVRATYQKYVDPLARSSVDLFWRLCEVLDASGSGFYLKGAVHLTKFEHYKALSTLYRLANLLGWIRALRRELMFLTSHSKKAQESLAAAIEKLGNALADGRQVETRRVEILRQLLIPESAPTAEQVKNAGIRIDTTLRNYLHNANVKNAQELTDGDKFELATKIAQELAASFERPPVTDDVARETSHRIASALTTREAWLYRDWQAAIGDVMLKPAPASSRLFEVIGYKEFEEVIHKGDEEDRMWLRRLYAILDDLDINGDRSKDARIEQLHNIHRANIALIKALQISDNNKSRVPQKTRDKIDKVLIEITDR